MRIIHFSDTHLGFQAFDAVNTEGVNAREQDVYDAFAYVVGRILTLKPDVVIHSGDFFHRPSPSNRALTFALEQLRRLGDRQIPLFVIAGNHETPKTVYTSPILRAFRTMPFVHSVFGDTWEKLELDGVALHGVPHLNDLRLLDRELERLESVSGKYNILLLHTSLGKRYLMEEYGEQVFPAAFEAKLRDFQYLALGHWHNVQQVDVHPNGWYCGSLERLSDTEIGAEKGFMILDIAPEGTCTPRFEAIPTRPWLKLELQRCFEKSIAELSLELEQFRSGVPAEAIVSLVFNDIKVEQALELSNLQLRQLFDGCFQLLIKRRSYSDRSFVRHLDADQFDRLDLIFADYIRDKYPDNPALADALIGKAARYFEF